MNAVVVAASWLGAGSLAAILVRLLRRRRIAVMVPAAGALAAWLVGAGPGHESVVLAQNGLTLDREALGLLAVGGASLTLVLLIAPRLDGREAFWYGVIGAMDTIALATGLPAVLAVALFAVVAATALRWVGAAPSRTSLAAARVPGVGAASLLAAAPFLPLVGIISGPRPVIAATLLAAGIGALLALFPLGGWAVGAIGSLRATEVAPWMLATAPAVLLIAQRIPAATPTAGDDFARLLLVGGLTSALLHAVMALRVPARLRYGRVFLADLGLAAAAVGSSHPALALEGGLLLVLAHLALAPVLLAGGGPEHPPLARAAWLGLAGLPPAPTFWARYLLLAAVVPVGPGQAAAALLAAGLLTIASLLTVVRFPAGVSRPEHPGHPAGVITGWLAVGSALALGVAPAAAAAAVFGR
jgi:hypothetical protein